MSRTKRTLLVTILAIASAAFGLVAALYVMEVHEDRQYYVYITGSVSLYDSEKPSPEVRGTKGLIQAIQPKDHVQVLRILHGRDYDAVHVRLDNGQEGYIFLGDNFELLR